MHFGRDAAAAAVEVAPDAFRPPRPAALFLPLFFRTEAFSYVLFGSRRDWVGGETSLRGTLRLFFSFLGGLWLHVVLFRLALRF